jgi:hypothetical protein
MKSAYELAMERLNAAEPGRTKPLTGEQKTALAGIDARFKAKIARSSCGKHSQRRRSAARPRRWRRFARR